MTLHLFTPYHDEALAQGSPYYYPSSAARTLMARWWALPALWAEAGDAVVRPDVAAMHFEHLLVLTKGFGERIVDKQAVAIDFYSPQGCIQQVVGLYVVEKRLEERIKRLVAMAVVNGSQYHSAV